MTGILIMPLFFYARNLFLLAFTLILCVHTNAYAELYLEEDAPPPRAEPEQQEPVKSWKSHLHGDAEIPNGQFKAYYFDRTEKPVRPTSDIVERVGIQGAIHTKGIKSDKFAAYWIGQFDFYQPTKKEFYFDISWAKVRLIIDGQLVPIKGEKAEYNFSAGSHVIEVEYVNNWHTVGFSMKMTDGNTFHTEEEIADFFKTIDDREYELHFVGVYESKNSDGSINVEVANRGKPVVLWFASYDGIIWNFKNKDDVFILGIIVASHSKGVSFDNKPEGVPIFYMNKYMGRYNKEVGGCHCAGHHFHCNDKTDILELSNLFQNKFGHGIDAFDVGYGLKNAYTANDPLDEKLSQRIVDARISVEQEKAACQEKFNPDFNTMFE